MLQVSFGQSKYYSDNLAENVKRGMRQKVKRGEWPAKAPLGYNNNPVTRNIEPNPFKARIVKIAFEEYSTGNYSIEGLSEHLHFLGLSNKFGKRLCKARISHILNNPAYIGLIKYNGELYDGRFEPIISKELWDKVQTEIKRRSRPRKQKVGHNFPFTDLLKCGECGCMITAQYAKDRRYLYYRCTKKNNNTKCNQPYLSDFLLLQQLRYYLKEISIPAKWAEIMFAELEKIKNKDNVDRKAFILQYKRQIKEIEKRIDKLINYHLEGTIKKREFLKKKEELLIEKVGIEEKKNNIQKRGEIWKHHVWDFIDSSFYAGRLSKTENYSEIKSFIKKNSKNRYLLDRKVVISPKEPYNIIVKLKLEHVLENFGDKEYKKYGNINNKMLSLKLLNDVIQYYMKSN